MEELWITHFGDNSNKRIVNIIRIVHQKEQLATRINMIPKKVDFFHIYFYEVRDSVQYRPPNANQVSNTNHFSFVSESPGRLVATSECMASSRKAGRGIQASLNASPVNQYMALKLLIITHSGWSLILVPLCMLGLLRDSPRCPRGRDTHARTRPHSAAGSTARVEPFRRGHRSGMSAPATHRLESHGARRYRYKGYRGHSNVT